MNFKIIAIESLSDNYIWLIIDEVAKTALIIDPGSSKPVASYLKQYNLQPLAILVTHRHWDHVNGIEDLVNSYNIPVFGPNAEFIPCLTHPLKVRDEFKVSKFGLNFTVIDLSGHTAGHIGFDSELGLFCGDTLFSAGCGRLFDGTAEQLHASIRRIAQCPAEKTIYCTHEYTLDNLRFAKAIEPNNKEIDLRINEVKELRDKNQSSLPFTLQQEEKYNPFLRTAKESVMQAVAEHSGQEIKNSEDCFKYLRLWKDGF